jgi:hypothetical protein
MKVDSILKMLVSIPKLNSEYLQESATSKVQVSWREFTVSCKQSHLQVFGQNILSAKKYFLTESVKNKPFGRNMLTTGKKFIRYKNEVHRKKKVGGGRQQDLERRKRKISVFG